jgi:ABC-type glycerol-3-phosphate transport system substrate-binding protein
MKIKKLILISIVCVLASVMFFGCPGKKDVTDTIDEPVTLSLWSFTNELERPIEYFEERNPLITIELTIVPSEDYPTKLRPILKSGEGAPDIFTGEAAFIKQFIEAGFYDVLEQAPYNVNASSLLKYTVDLGRNPDGKIVALSWQGTPGGIFYRRSLAKQFLGTDDPAEVAKYFTTWDKMIETGNMVHDQSNGEVFLIPGIGDLQNMVLAQRSKPWVVDGKLFLDPKMVDYFDVAKQFRDEGLEAQIGQWSPAWFDSMKADTNVFCQFMPTWGLHYVMKPNAPDSSGDWGVVKGPYDWYWGGTWLGIYKDSKNKAASWEFVKMMTLDPEFGEWWAKETGDFLSNNKVVDKIKGDFSEPYLGGQNHYEYFAEAAKGIDGSLFSSYDQEINGMFFNQVLLYVEDQVTKEEAIANFKSEVANAYPDLIVE